MDRKDVTDQVRLESDPATRAGYEYFITRCVCGLSYDDREFVVDESGSGACLKCGREFKIKVHVVEVRECARGEGLGIEDA